MSNKGVLNEMNKFIRETKGIHSAIATIWVRGIFEQAVELIEELEAKAQELDLINRGVGVYDDCDTAECRCNRCDEEVESHFNYCPGCGFVLNFEESEVGNE